MKNTRSKNKIKIKLKIKLKTVSHVWLTVFVYKWNP